MKRLSKLNTLPACCVYDEVLSPVGPLIMLASSVGLHAIFWDINQNYNAILAGFKRSPEQKILLKTKKQLSEYFLKQRKNFDLPLLPEGTAFQLSAWRELSKIPYGQTISYGEQARRLGDKNKARAVGLANGANPLPIIIPCHRVIGRNGKLTGFAGGLDKKSFLLLAEGSLDSRPS